MVKIGRRTFQIPSSRQNYNTFAKAAAGFTRSQKNHTFQNVNGKAPDGRRFERCNVAKLYQILDARLFPKRDRDKFT